MAPASWSPPVAMPLRRWPTSKPAGGQGVVVPGDLTDPAVRSRLIDAAAVGLGRIDVLVNNAAYTSGEGMNQSIDVLSMHEWERQFAVNVHIPMALIQAVVPHMRRGGGGVIVNVTSPSAELVPVVRGMGSGAYGPLFGYATTKAVLNRMTNVLAADLEGDDIALVAFDPGLVLTENAEEAITRAGIDPAIAAQPAETGRLIAALAASGMTHSGEVVRASEGRIVRSAT